MPFAGTRVIHPHFEQHHESVPAGAATARVRVVLPDPDGVRDPEAGRTTYGPGRVLYVGGARIQRLDTGRSEVRTESDRITTKGDYLIVITRLPPHPLLLRAVVEVIEPADASNLVTYTIREVARGSLRWETDLRCDLLLPTNTGGAP